MEKRPFKEPVPYLLLACFCLILSLLLGWSSYATRINHTFYDLFFRQRGPRPAGESIVIVAIDDATLSRYGALPLNRSLLARGLGKIQQARPRLVAIDLLLADRSTPESDSDLEQALGEPPPAVSATSLKPEAGKPAGVELRAMAPVVLATALEAEAGGKWLEPLPEFARKAAVLGHTHADPDADGVNRQVLLAKQGDRQRYWALALECFRLLLGAREEPITETDLALEVPRGLPAASSTEAHWAQGGRREMADGGPAVDRFTLGAVSVPVTRREQRALRINYVGGNQTFPQISLASLLEESAGEDRLRGKIVLLGVTAQATGDRLFTPFSAGLGMAGVEIHANILHTLLTGEYLRPASDFNVVLAVLGITLATAWALARFQGLALVGLLVGLGGVILIAPYRLFLTGQVWPAFSLLLPFGTTLSGCGAYQLLSARRKFTESEARRQRSQQQFEMATHEIRTPLTAIQGSSELLSRYPLDESKRKETIERIYRESQRLGKLVERFLDVEKLSAGEMELRRATVDLASLLEAAVERLRPVAERKGVRLIRESAGPKVEIEADPELLEFAVSNLLTNAVKYSPAGSAVRLSLERHADRVAVRVSDCGPGLSPEESRRVFGRFFRTEGARRSGAPGFGLGLAIAREIARHHGGDVQLETKPGAGSRFTISLPAGAPSAADTAQGRRKGIAR